MEHGWTIKQHDEPLLNESSRRHGNFRVGVQKEANIIDLVKIEDPDEIETLIENFISSGERIEVVQTPEQTSVSEFRKMISDKLLHLSKFSPMYRRVIVREYDGILYLARRAFWNRSSKWLPFEYSDELSYETEIGIKVRQQNENVRTIKTSIEHMAELTPEQLEEIKAWEEQEQLNEQLQVIRQVITIK